MSANSITPANRGEYRNQVFGPMLDIPSGRARILEAMRRIEKKLFAINDRIAAVKRDEELAAEELIFHQHLHDDAVRDAAVSDSPFDREDARVTGGDVQRFERHVAALRETRVKLEAQRDELLGKLGG